MRRRCGKFATVRGKAERLKGLALHRIPRRRGAGRSLRRASASSCRRASASRCRRVAGWGWRRTRGSPWAADLQPGPAPGPENRRLEKGTPASKRGPKRGGITAIAGLAPAVAPPPSPPFGRAPFRPLPSIAPPSIAPLPASPFRRPASVASPPSPPRPASPLPAPLSFRSLPPFRLRCPCGSAALVAPLPLRACYPCGPLPPFLPPSGSPGTSKSLQNK